MFTTPTSIRSGQSRWVQHLGPFNHLKSIFGSQSVETLQVVNDLDLVQLDQLPESILHSNVESSSLLVKLMKIRLPILIYQ